MHLDALVFATEISYKKSKQTVLLHTSHRLDRQGPSENISNYLTSTFSKMTIAHEATKRIKYRERGNATSKYMHKVNTRFVVGRKKKFGISAQCTYIRTISTNGI